MFTNKKVIIDASFQLKFKNLHSLKKLSALAFLEKIVVNEHVVIQEFVKLAVLSLIIEQNNVCKFQKNKDTEFKQLDNAFVIVLERLPIDA